MASRVYGHLTLITAGAEPRPVTGQLGALIAWLRGSMAFRFRRWRDYRQTQVELRYLDHRQLKEFGIHERPPELMNSKFP